jgi:hypothetical protein
VPFSSRASPFDLSELIVSLLALVEVLDSLGITPLLTALPTLNHLCGFSKPDRRVSFPIPCLRSLANENDAPVDLRPRHLPSWG